MDKNPRIGRLSELVEVLMGTSPSGTTVNSLGNGMPLLNGPTEFTSRYPVAVQFTTKSVKSCRAGDLLFCVRGSTTGRMNWADKEYSIGRGLAAIRHRKDKKLQPFIRALVENGLPGLLALATGSTFPSVSKNDIEGIQVRIPPIEEQYRIADILGTLDDKIELNRRMNETLEAMARRLFKSWFVDFDPVHAKARLRREHPNLSNAELSRRALPNLAPEIAELFPDDFEQSTQGSIPKGWKAGRLGDVVEVLDSKRIPLSSRERALRRGQFPYYGAASIMDYVDDFLFEGIHVLMGEDGSVISPSGKPVLQYVWGKYWVNNHAHVLRGVNGVSNEHLYLHLQRVDVAPFVTGAVQPKINQGNLNLIPFIIPPADTCAAFSNCLTSHFETFRHLSDEIEFLKRTRDQLMPRLLSGELPSLLELK